MSELEQRQIELERSAVEQGVSRYRAEIEKAQAKGLHLYRSPVGEEMLASLAWHYGKLLELIHVEPGYEWAHELIQPGTAWRWATIVLNVVVGHPQLPSGIPVVSLGFDIMEAARDEIRYDHWLERDPHAGAAITKINRTQHRVKVGRARRIVKQVRAAEVGRVAPGSYRWRLQWDGGLIRVLVDLDHNEFGRGFFALELRRMKNREVWHLTPSDEARERLRLMHDSAAAARPSAMPMVAPPRPWRRVTATGESSE